MWLAATLEESLYLQVILFILLKIHKKLDENIAAVLQEKETRSIHFPLSSSTYNNKVKNFIVII